MALVCGVSFGGGCGAGQRDDARGLILVLPLGRCLAHVGGVRQVMPPWLGSWFVPLPAPWCALLRGGAPWCVVGWNDVSGLYIHVDCNSLGGGAVCFACPPPVVANAFNFGIVGG